jgi:hypothetical protein
MDNKRKLLIVFLSDEVERQLCWNRPNDPKIVSLFDFRDKSYVKRPGMLYTAWRCQPKLALNFGRRFKYLYPKSFKNVVREVGRLALLDADSVYNIPEVVPFLIEGNATGFELLEFWEPPPVVYLLRFIHSPHREVV